MPSPVENGSNFATAAKAAGKRVIHLNIGHRHRHAYGGLGCGATDTRTVVVQSSEGFASYREGLAAYYRSVNVEVAADDILVTTGGSEALVFAFMS